MGPPGQGDVSAHLIVKWTQTPGSEVKFMDVRSCQGRARTWLCLSGVILSLFSYDARCPIALFLNLGGGILRGVSETQWTFKILCQIWGCEHMSAEGRSQLSSDFQSFPELKTIKSNWLGDIFFLAFPFDWDRCWYTTASHQIILIVGFTRNWGPCLPGHHPADHHGHLCQSKQCWLPLSHSWRIWILEGMEDTTR